MVVVTVLLVGGPGFQPTATTILRRSSRPLVITPRLLVRVLYCLGAPLLLICVFTLKKIPSLETSPANFRLRYPRPIHTTQVPPLHPTQKERPLRWRLLIAIRMNPHMD